LGYDPLSAPPQLHSFAGSKPRTDATKNSAAKSPNCATNWLPLTANSGKPGADLSIHPR
jgi:hypothetical protein